MLGTTATEKKKQQQQQQQQLLQTANVYFNNLTDSPSHGIPKSFLAVKKI